MTTQYFTVSMQKVVFVSGGHSPLTHLPPVVRGKERMTMCVDVHSMECVCFSPAFSSREGCLSLIIDTPPAIFSESGSMKTQNDTFGIFSFFVVMSLNKLKYYLKEINDNQ